MSENNYTASEMPDDCDICVDIIDNCIKLKVTCNKVDEAILSYILEYAQNNSRCNNKLNKMIIHLNINDNMKLYELFYLLSGKLYSLNLKVAYVYTKLADFIDSDLIDIMKGNDYCNLFNNFEDADRWLFEETTT